RHFQHKTENRFPRQKKERSQRKEGLKNARMCFLGYFLSAENMNAKFPLLRTSAGKFVDINPLTDDLGCSIIITVETLRSARLSLK
ncbi:MAG: hypothetical protein AAF485_30665, partial [Chloroflexota bacterium]